MQVQIPMSFLEAPPTSADVPVWPTLDLTTKGELVATLARLIAKTMVGGEVGSDPEVQDE